MRNGFASFVRFASFAGFAVWALALIVSAAPPAGQAARTAAAQDLPPISYVCPMPGDEDVIEDKPGDCPKCKMTLVPIRLDAKWWCPVHQALEVHDGPGKCRRDGRDLVQVTVSEFWTCADAPDKRLLEPGKCGNGQARKINYELRAHGDHNPRHGGQFYMAADAWHHLEGAYPEAGLFRMFFYDNFTKPLEVKGFTGSVVILDRADKEVASIPLSVGRDRTTMEAKIPPQHAALPLRATAKMKFSATTREQPFDFQFNEYSKDLPQATAPAARPAPTPAPAAPAPRPSAAATPPPAPAAPTPSAPGGQRAADPITDPLATEIAAMPPALAAALDETSLPKTTPELVAEVERRATQINTFIRAGNLGEVWVPAMGTKTAALVLESHTSAIPAQQRAAATGAIKRVVTAAWEIDGYADMGNRSKIVEAYERLASAVADLKVAYGTR